MEVGVGTRFALASLVTWHVSRLTTEEDGPADTVVWLRARLGSDPLGRLMDSFACVSLWVAASARIHRRARPP